MRAIPIDPLPWYRLAAPVMFVTGLTVLCVVKNMTRFRAMLLGIGLMSGYGMIQDQVSARLCPEYFTHLHPPISGLADPTLLGFVWGFLGAWWGGAFLGYAAGLAATVGKKPPLPTSALVRPLLGVVLATGFVAAVTGVAVALHADALGVAVTATAADAVVTSRHQNLLTVSCYHFAAYVTATVAGVGTCIRIARRRVAT